MHWWTCFENIIHRAKCHTWYMAIAISIPNKTEWLGVIAPPNHPLAEDMLHPVGSCSDHFRYADHLKM